MSKSKIDILEDVADEIGGRVYKGYSGRGMFGASCYGISCENTLECIEVAAAKGLRGARTDSLGREFIVYWPSIKCEDAEDEP